MPYINQHDRFHAQDNPVSAGELNYAVTMMVIAFVARNGLNYQVINDVIGALEGAKGEFQRRVVAPYEDGKIHDNGDLPWPS